VILTVTLDPEQIASQLAEETGDEWAPDKVERILNGLGEDGLIEKMREPVLDFLAEAAA
jgi:hypothetical protein